MTGEWIRTSRRLPPKGVYVEGYWSRLTEATRPAAISFLCPVVVRRGVPMWYAENGVEMVPPTHWRPLPEPPTK